MRTADWEFGQSRLLAARTAVSVVSVRSKPMLLCRSYLPARVSVRCRCSRQVRTLSPAEQSWSGNRNSFPIVLICVGLLVLATALWAFVRRRRRAPKPPHPHHASIDTSIITEMDASTRPGHSRHISELSGSSSGYRSTIAPLGTMSELDEHTETTVRHELEDKTDTAAWALNVQRQHTPQYELPANEIDRIQSPQSASVAWSSSQRSRRD